MVLSVMLLSTRAVSTIESVPWVSSTCFASCAEIVARIVEGAFYALDAPVVRITAPDTPVPI